MEALKKKLQDEITTLEHELQVELPKEIRTARAHGDLSENAEYHAAKEEQQKVQGRINELEEKLRSAQILDETAVPAGEVRIGATVVLKDLSDGERATYTLVDSAEADFAKGKISVRSPLSEGLLGHKVGETVEVKLPSGPAKFKIEKVSREA